MRNHDSLKNVKMATKLGTRGLTNDHVLRSVTASLMPSTTLPVPVEPVTRSATSLASARRLMSSVMKRRWLPVLECG